jgi:hypothetical protein
MLTHLRTLLGEGVAHPEEPVAALAMISDEERRLLLNQGNDGESTGREDFDPLSDDELDALLSDFSADDLATHE